MNQQDQFEKENSLIFLYKLITEFGKINRDIKHHLGRELEVPRFVLTRGKTILGTWSKDSKKLCISEELVRNYEWGAVVHVLKHEVAHMIVSEIFNMNDGRSHGEAFSKACRIIGCSNRRCCSTEFLEGFAGVGNEQPIVAKIRKLMAKGQCEGASESEAETFMKKAQQMMDTYNLSNEDIIGMTKIFVKRPVGGLHERFPTWLWDLGHLVCKNYGVQNIRTYTYDRSSKQYCFLELFGEPHNVDIAEYVFHVVMAQGESLYEKYKKSERNSEHRLSKASFMKGLISGYSSTLKIAKNDIVHTNAESALISANDFMLKEKHRQAYPKMTTVKTAGPCGDGYWAGKRAGEGIVVRSGLKGSQSVKAIGN